MELVCVPAVIRTSANWDTEKVKKKKLKSKKSRLPSNNNSAVITVTNNSINNNVNPSSQCLVGVLDVWYGPGIGVGVTTDVAYVDCVVSKMPLVSTRGKSTGLT
ncbi:E3 ubiquitin-protein ligase [Forsythia ovata]|uniref:E3 ubiquitin-protein ligase n=1 Tax=Forsythia ovata TaxID=205694 RepID=A0ABD1Q9G3_9LAMI